MPRWKPDYYLFVSEAARDEYLYKLIAKGHQVERTVIEGDIPYRLIADAPDGPPDAVYRLTLYTVRDVDRRVGKARDNRAW